MVRIHQSARASNDSVAVGVGVICKRDVETIAHREQRTIAYGDEQSILILPSQSAVMKRNVGSTTSLTTVALIYFSITAGQ